MSMFVSYCTAENFGRRKLCGEFGDLPKIGEA